MVRFKRRAGTKLSGIWLGNESTAFKVLATMPLFTQFYKVKVESLPTANFRDEELTEVIEDIAEHVNISDEEFKTRVNGINWNDILGAG